MKAPERINMSGAGVNQGRVSEDQIKSAEARYKDAQEAAETAKKQADAAIAGATSGDQIKEARAKAEKAVIDLERAKFEFERLKAAAVPLTEGQGKASNFYRRTLSSYQDFDRLGLDPDSMIGSYGYIVAPSITHALSSDKRNAYRSAVENFIAATLRLESGASILPDEFARQYRIYFPGPDAGPEEIEQKRRARLLAIQGLKAEAGPGARQAELDLAAQGYEIPGINAKEDLTGPSATETPAGAGAETTTVKIPDAVQQAMIAYVNAKGKNLDPKEYKEFFDRIAKENNLDAIVTEEEAKRVVEAIKGGARFGGVGPLERKLTPEERGINEALLSGPGGAAATFVNATTMGIPGLFSENWGRSVEGAREASPVWGAAGDILGSAAMTAGGGAGLRFVGMSVPKAEVLSDLIYSGITGATGAPEGDRVSGALTNSLLSLTGSAAPSVVRRSLLPNPDPDIRLLRESGVRLTPAQTIGGRFDRTEEAASRLLLVGGDIGLAARRRAFNDFNTAYLNKAGKYINFELPNDLRPKERMKLMGEAFDNQYDNIRSQMSVAPDQDLLNDIADLRAMINDGVTFTADNAKRLNKLLDDQLVRRTANPLDGQGYKSLHSLLGKRRNAFAKAQNQELADGVEQMQYILDNAARRRSPPEVVQMLDDTDRGFAIFAGAQEAAGMAGSRPGEFTPSQILNRQRAADTRARSRSFIEGDMEGQDLAEAAQNILGNVEPRSGTPERLAAGMAVTGGAGYFSPFSLLPNAAIGLMNAPVVRDVLPALFAGNRPAPLRVTGELMEKYKAPISRFGSATAQQFNPYEQTPEDYAVSVLEGLSTKYQNPPSEEVVTVRAPGMDQQEAQPKQGTQLVPGPDGVFYLMENDKFDFTPRDANGNPIEQKARGGLMRGYR